MIQLQKDQFTADLTAKVWDIFDKGSVFYDKVARTISEHVNQHLPQTGEGWISVEDVKIMFDALAKIRAAIGRDGMDEQFGLDEYDYIEMAMNTDAARIANNQQKKEEV